MNLLLRGFWIPKEQGSQRHERTSGSGIPESSQGQTEQTSMRNQSDREHTAFGLPAAVSLGPMQPPVSLEFLTFVTIYLFLCMCLVDLLYEMYFMANLFL